MSAPIELDFPFEELDALAEFESWRKEVNRPIYHIHKWWANRLGSVFRAIVLHTASDHGSLSWDDFYRRHRFDQTVILDPFMGSGTTLGEAVKLGAKAIGCDINPVSMFIVRQALSRVPLVDLQAAFDAVAADVQPLIARYYKTRLSTRPQGCRVTRSTTSG